MAMADDRTEELREAARHRGLKLLTSRRRKPGTGDYGRFGLTDASGKALLGVGKDGLTATPDEIAGYLRAGAAATWAESARTAPARAVPKPVKTERKRTARPIEAKPPKADPLPEPEPEPPSEPPEARLAIRKAKPADAASIAALTGSEQDRVRQAMQGRSAVFVAERDSLVGCVACQPVVTIQHGPIGRLTMIVVDEAERRQGIGRALIEAARTFLEKQDCTVVEMMSAIELRNANGFLRALGFQRHSYRFTIG